MTDFRAYKKDSVSDPPISFQQPRLTSQEFKAWLIEERKLNPDTLSRDRNRRELLAFIEDYNTGSSNLLVRRHRLTIATLAHEKVLCFRGG